MFIFLPVALAAPVPFLGLDPQAMPLYLTVTENTQAQARSVFIQEPHRALAFGVMIYTGRAFGFGLKRRLVRVFYGK